MTRCFTVLKSPLFCQEIFYPQSFFFTNVSDLGGENLNILNQFMAFFTSGKSTNLFKWQRLLALPEVLNVKLNAFVFRFPDGVFREDGGVYVCIILMQFRDWWRFMMAA